MQEKINKHYQEIVDFLVQKGVEYWKACDDARSVAAYVLLTVADTIMERQNMDERAQDRLRQFIETNPSTDQLHLFMGVTKEEIDTEHEQELARVVALLPQAYKSE